MKLQHKFKNVKYLIIDEISMIGLKILNIINKNLQLAKGNSQIFGGLHILFSGDFYQHSAVLQTQIYNKTNSEKEQTCKQTTNEHVDELNGGRLLWSQLTHCVILTEQMQQSNDPKYASLLDRLRSGNYTNETIKEDIDLLNSRLIKKDTIYDKPWKDAPVCVSQNELREAINLSKIKKCSSDTKSTLLYCKANDKIGGHNLNITASIQFEIDKLEEHKTGNLMSRLPLVQNSEYFITANIVTKYGIVNSAKVKLVSICTEDSNILKISEYLNKPQTFETTPKFLIVKLIDSKSLNKIQLANLADEHFFLEPITKSFKVRTTALSSRHVNVNRTQLPLTPAYAVTSYKLQGKTVNKLIVDLTIPTNGKVDFEFAYVALSRVKSINDILILRPFNKKILQTKLPVDLKVEMTRLENLEQKTISEFYKLF
jgi:hypothetical protein